jgi:hypothetical protein
MPYCNAAAKFKSSGLAGYLGIYKGVVLSLELEKRFHNHEKEEPFFDDSKGNASGTSASPESEAKGK